MHDKPTTTDKPQHEATKYDLKDLYQSHRDIQPKQSASKDNATHLDMTNPYKNDDTAKQKSADSPAASQRDGKPPQFDFSDLPAKAPPAKEPFKPSELPDLPPKPVQLKPLEFEISDIPPGNLARRPADQNDHEYDRNNEVLRQPHA